MQYELTTKGIPYMTTTNKLWPKCYVAGPYSTGDPQKNTDAALAIGDQLLSLQVSPFVPHLSHYWETLHTAHDYETWMSLDFSWVAASDYVLRMPGVSAGADREVALAKELGIPVVYSVRELVLLLWEKSECVG